jgi:hypothetical protein
MKPDRTVDFYVDRDFTYRTEHEIVPPDSGLYLVIGSRSHHGYGPALIDTIRVYSYSEQPVQRLTGTALEHDL